ncbi:MAG TPA: signal recognition particle-docking protein FtsY [Patescibacteria group bacterium]|nr:signal recognition particle-docking protein FtsY [Patescibacteria group bacterium]
MKRLVQGLRKTKERLLNPLRAMLASRDLDDTVIDDIEGLLFSADLGVDATERIIGRLRARAGEGAGNGEEYLRLVADEILAVIDDVPVPYHPEGHPRVIVVVGVNGVGKTSTIGKLAHRFRMEGGSVLLAACDTFRAAANEQLELWAQRAGVPIIRQRAGADPAAVAFDAVHSARSKGIDTVIVDTAGRLHTKTNLMEELKKIFRVLSTRIEGIALEAWLVIDANLGQNSLRQAEAFVDALPITGLVLTKMDSTAKGGAVIPIQQQLRVPVLYVGLGEGIDDIEPFDHRIFVSAIVGEPQAP